MIDQELSNVIENLREEILRDPCVIRFMELADFIRNSPELQKLEKDIALAKKGMTLNMSDDKKYFRYKNNYESLLAKRKNNPIICNFEIYRDEVRALLKEVESVLNED